MPAAPSPPAAAPAVAIVLSTFNGAPFLQAQLDSLALSTWLLAGLRDTAELGKRVE